MARASPTTPTSTGRCAPIASRSRSTWMSVVSRADQCAVPGRPLVQRGAERDDQVGLLQQPLGGRGGEAAGDAEVERVADEEPVGHGGGRQHGAESLAERAQGRAGAGQDGAAAGDDRGTLGTCEGGDHGGQVARRGRGEVGDGRRRRELDLRGLHVERQVEDDGPALPLRAAHRSRGVGDRGRGGVHPLGHGADRSDERVLVDLEVRAQLHRGRVRREQQHRGTALRGLGQARDGVRQARTLVHGRDAEPPAHPRVAVGHAHRPGLVAGGEEAATGGDDRVRHGQVPAPHQAEHDVSTQGVDGAADGLGDEHRANASVCARCGQRRRCWCSAPSRRWSRSRSTSSGSRPRRCSPRCWSG